MFARNSDRSKKVTNSNDDNMVSVSNETALRIDSANDEIVDILNPKYISDYSFWFVTAVFGGWRLDASIYIVVSFRL